MVSNRILLFLPLGLVVNICVKIVISEGWQMLSVSEMGEEGIHLYSIVCCIRASWGLCYGKNKAVFLGMVQDSIPRSSEISRKDLGVKSHYHELSV